MKSFMDRDLQHDLLARLKVDFPYDVEIEEIADVMDGVPINPVAAYLEGHGLIAGHWSGHRSVRTMTSARITPAGLDFLADDGGLTAILGIVTVKLHEDTIRQLIIRKIDESDADETVKERLKDQLKDIPAETMKSITGKLVESGIEKVPSIVAFLASFLG